MPSYKILHGNLTVKAQTLLPENKNQSSQTAALTVFSEYRNALIGNIPIR